MPLSMTEEFQALQNPSAIGLAVTVQSVTMMSIGFGSWALMYFYSPSTSLRVQYPKLNSLYQKGERVIERMVTRFPPSIRNNKNIDLKRLVTSGTEAWVIRKFFLPITYPGSIALGIFVARRYSQWRWPEKYNRNNGEYDNQYRNEYGHGYGNDYRNDYNNNYNNNYHSNERRDDERNDTLFGWNKIERQQTQHYDFDDNQNQYNRHRNNDNHYR